MNLLGPISSSLVNRWGCRPVTIAGAILASSCLIISSFAQNVTTLYFTIGIGTGLGFGLIYLPAIVSVTMYFEKRRSLATGIAVCGSGFGTFIFAPLINLLLTHYGWRGAMLIVAAIVLECIIFGSLFRPLEYETDRSLEILPIEESTIPLKCTQGDMHLDDSKTNFGTLSLPSEPYRIDRPRSVGQFTFQKSFKSSTLEKNGNISNGKLKNNQIARLALSHPVLFSEKSETVKCTHYGSQHLKRSRPLMRPDVFYQGSLLNIPSYKSRHNLRNPEETELMDRSHSVISRRRQYVEKETTVCGCVPCSQETKETLQEMLDFSLFKDPIFIVFVLSNFFTSIGFNVPYVYIVSKARYMQISPEKASMLLSVIGAANTVGRIVLGYFSDNPKINRLLVYNLCLTTCGIGKQKVEKFGQVYNVFFVCFQLPC